MKKYVPGTLKSSFKAKRSRGNRFEVAAGVTGAFYAKWVEFGHLIKTHGPKASRRVVGHVPANPFIRRTFEEQREAALEVARKGLLEAIQKAVAKMQSKMPKV